MMIDVTTSRQWEISENLPKIKKRNLISIVFVIKTYRFLCNSNVSNDLWPRFVRSSKIL